MRRGLVVGKPNLQHGHTSREGTTVSVSKTYQSWMAMKARCYNPNRAQYKWYGGRGIEVCERWHTFVHFLEDMGERPEGTTLDRLNPDGNYELANCRWATSSEQSENQSRGNQYKTAEERNTSCEEV